MAQARLIEVRKLSEIPLYPALPRNIEKIPHFDAQGQVVGVEILHLSSRVAPERLRILQFETASETLYFALCKRAARRLCVMHRVGPM